jgi:1-acyl-sn-glycerol-3-phosphate acyltransferase
MRLALRSTAILAGFCLCVPLHYLWKLFGARSIWPQLFLAYAGRCCGIRVRIEGTPLREKVLVAANHVSWLDVLILGGATPVNFVARHDVEGWPAVGWAADLNDTIYISRDARSTVRGQADALRQALQEGRAIALFPEGTTEAARELLPFRASLFASLYPALDGVQVQPVAIDYGEAFDAVAWIGDEGYTLNARRILSRPGTMLITLRFLAPIDPRVPGDRKRLAALLRAAVADALNASEPGSDPLYPPR